MEHEDEELMDQEGEQGQEMDQWECAGEMNLKGLMDQGKMMVQEARYLKELLMVKGRSERKEVLMEAPHLSELNGLVLMDHHVCIPCEVEGVERSGESLGQKHLVLD